MSINHYFNIGYLCIIIIFDSLTNYAKFKANFEKWINMTLIVRCLNFITVIDSNSSHNSLFEKFIRFLIIDEILIDAFLSS